MPSLVRMRHGYRVSGEEAGVPKELLGPTGDLYMHPEGGESTEISETVTDPRLNEGRATNIPQLSRNQQNVRALLAGRKRSRPQYERMVKDAVARQREGEHIPSYDDVDTAVGEAVRHHEDVGKALVPYVANMRKYR